MSMGEGASKDFEAGLLAIILSLILGIVVYFVSLYTKAYPPSNIEIIVKRIGTFALSSLSPLTLSFIFMGIINLSAFYRLRHGFRMLSSDHYGIAGSSLLIASSIFLIFGNAGLLMSAFLSSITFIVVLAWVGFMIVSVIFGISGTLLLGLGFRKLGEVYKNSIIKRGAILITSVILSYFGYIITYVGVRKLKPLNVQQTSSAQPLQLEQNVVRILGYGILRGDGSVRLNLVANLPCTIVSAKIDNLSYTPKVIVNRNLRPYKDQRVVIRFDKKILSELVKGIEYDLHLTVKVKDLVSDHTIKIIYGK